MADGGFEDGSRRPTRLKEAMRQETAEIDILAAAVTTYVARRRVEGERALAGDTELGARDRLINDIVRRQRRRTMQAVLRNLVVYDMSWFLLHRLLPTASRRSYTVSTGFRAAYSWALLRFGLQLSLP
jgi:hypothetical protein